MLRVSILALLLTAVSAPAQTPSSSAPTPNNLIRTVVDHQVKADNDDHSHWMYKDVAGIPEPAMEKTVIETENGDLDCLNRIGNQPLTPAQRRAEVQRIRNFVGDASAQRKALKASSADDEKSASLFRMLPDAFLFTLAEAHGDTEKLTFEPNPAFQSHSMEEYVFHKMSGFVVVNTRELRLVEIAGTLTHGVEFVGGLLGHLDAGGTFDVRLTEVAPYIWKVSRLKVDMRGKVLFFKTVGDQEDETRSDFHQVPDSLTFTQAEQMLTGPRSNRPTGQ
jgi:hypothetical protein